MFLENVSQGNIFSNTPERRYQIFLSKKEKVLQSFHHITMFVQSIKQESDKDCQQVVLNDDLMEFQHSQTYQNKTFPLMSSMEKMKCRKARAVL